MTTRRSGVIADRHQRAAWREDSPRDEGADGTRGSFGTSVDDPGGGLTPPPSATPEMSAVSPADDRWIGHFLRLLGVLWLVGLSMFLLVGFFWLAHIFNRTGHRRRDLLWLLVPVVGVVLEYRALWRYTARSAYWTPRADRSSDLLRGWQRPWAIGTGWAVGPLFFTVLILASAAGEEGSTKGDALVAGVFRSEQGGFEAAFPVTPSRSVTTEQSGGLTLETTTYWAASDGLEYSVTYVDWPEGEIFSFDGALDGMVQSVDEGVVTSRARTTVAGFDALRATVVHSYGHLKVLIVRGSDRFYVVGAGGETRSDDARGFVGSFDLTTGERPTTTSPPSRSTSGEPTALPRLPAPSDLILQIEPGSCSQTECRLVATWTDNSAGETQFNFYEQDAGLIVTVPSATSEGRGVVEGARPGVATPVGFPLCVWATAVAASGQESAASNRVCFTLSPTSTGDLR